MRKFALVIACAVLTGCQTESATPSGRHEVTIQSMNPDQAKPKLVNAMLNDGRRLKSETPYQVVFEKPWGNVVGAAVVGALVSTDASSAVERLSLYIAEVDGGTRIVADRYMVKVGAFGREDVNPANNGLGLARLIRQRAPERLASVV